MASPHERIPGTSRGEVLAKEKQEEGAKMFQLSDPRAQLYLIRHAFPQSTNPVEDWQKGEEEGDSLSLRFRGYRDDPANEGKSVVLDTPEALEEFLSAVKAHEPDRTLH